MNKEGRIPDIGYPCRPRSGLHREHGDRARPGVSHQRLGPRRTAGPARPPPAAGLRGLSADTAAASLVPTNARRGRPGARAGRDHGLRAPLRQRSRPGGHHASRSPPSSRWMSRWARSTTTRRSGFVDDPMATAHVWYRALNCGFRLPAGRGHRRDDQLRLAARAGGDEPGLRADRWRRWTSGGCSTRFGRPELRHQRPAARASRRAARAWARSCASQPAATSGGAR